MQAQQVQKQIESGELKYRLLISARLFITLLVGIGVGLVMITRNNINMAIICMVTDAQPTSNISDAMHGDVIADAAGDVIIVELPGNDSIQLDGQAEFDWDKPFQALLLSSYFYGYTAGLFPGGMVADRLPANWVLLFCAGSQGALNLLVPLVARANKYVFLALRALMGLTCAALLPASTVLIRNWSIPEEYSTLFAIAWSLSYLGAGSSYPLSSSLCEAGGWPMVYYVTGALPVLWCVLAWFLMANSPDESRLCSEKECSYILVRRLCRVTTKKSIKDRKERKAPMPVWSIVTNRQVLIITTCFFTYNWFYYSININLPVFLKETMGVDVFENGLLSGLPTMSMSVGVVIGGRLLQHFRTWWNLSQTNARKIINSIGMLTPAVLLGVILVLPPGSRYSTMVLLCAANAIGVFAVSGGPLSAGPDIGPQYAGIIWGFTGSFGNFTGVLNPLVAAAMTTNKTLAEWRQFFLVAVVMLVVANMLVAFFWKSQVQKFARTEDSDSQQPEESTQHTSAQENV